jgi:hypothetical protein
MRRSLVILAVAAACLAAGSTVGVSRAAAVCSTFTQDKLTYHSETLGTGWSCSSAKTWIKKLSKDHVNVVSTNVPLTNGPTGLHCFATVGSHGHATSGDCIKGTIAFPKSGFAWFTG